MHLYLVAFLDQNGRVNFVKFLPVCRAPLGSPPCFVSTKERRISIAGSSIPTVQTVSRSMSLPVCPLDPLTLEISYHLYFVTSSSFHTFYFHTFYVRLTSPAIRSNTLPCYPDPRFDNAGALGRCTKLRSTVLTVLLPTST